MTLLALRDVRRSFGAGGRAVEVLHGVSLAIAAGELVAIMGPSGSGKSTLMNILGLLDRPTTGSLVFAGQEVGRLSDDGLARLRGRAIGFVFQSYNLMQRRSALENVELPLLYAGVARRERRRRAEDALAAVGLAGKGRHRPHQLSGGEQQRVAVARALVRDPPLILADEPTGALDTRTGAQILDLFQGLHRQGRTIVVVTHDPKIAVQCGRTLRIADGHLDPERRLPRVGPARLDGEGRRA